MTIVGGSGHMENGEYVADTVTVRVKMPGGWAVTANDTTEEKAYELARQTIEKAKQEFAQQLQARVAMGAISQDEAARMRAEAHLDAVD